MTAHPAPAPLRVHDSRVLDLLDADVTVERLGGDARWSEGPLYLPADDAVIWSDIPGDRVLRWTAATGAVTVDRQGVEFTNGRTLDREGRVVECSHGERAVLRREPDGSTTVLADRWGGVRLNSPNDVVVRSDGSVWFTDPSYGITQPAEGHPGEREYGAHWVFRVDAESGAVEPVVQDMADPNGLAFSPDESILYVSDSGPAHHIRAYDVTARRRCANGRVLAVVSPGVPDGLRVDAHGNVWTSSGDSVQVLAPDGNRLGAVPVPEVVANLCFGGPDGTTLFVTATSGLYRLPTRVRGASRGPREG